MRRIHAHCRTKRDGMKILWQEFKIRTMGIIHDKRCFIPAAGFSKRADVQHIAKVIRRCNVDRIGNSVRFGYRILYIKRRYSALAKMLLLVMLQPNNVNVKHRRRTNESRVSISSCKDQWALAPFLFTNQSKHRLDCQGRALGGIKAMRSAVKRGEIILALIYNSISRIKHVCTAYFGNIIRLTAKLTHALVTGHMKASGLSLCVSLYKIINWCRHSSVSAMFNITAHSILFLKSSQPYLYTPPIEPVA